MKINICLICLIRGFIRRNFWEHSNWYKSGWEKKEMTDFYWSGKDNYCKICGGCI